MKFLKGILYKGNKKKGIEKIKSCKFYCNLLELIWESVRETKFFELSIFHFFFVLSKCFRVHLRFSSAEFSVEFSFSCLSWENFCSRLSFGFPFTSWKASWLFKIFFDNSRSKSRNPWSGLSFCAFSLVPDFVLSFDLDFISCEAPFKKWVTKRTCWLFFLRQFHPRIRTEGLKVVLDKKWR